ncbi:MAG: hypothetical protein ABI700_26315 [Chloroflexota bacterium]
MTDFDPEDDDLYAYDDEFEALDEPRPLWTRHRILLTVVVIIIVVTFLAYTLQGFFIPPPPPPTFIPGSLI